MTQSTEPGKIWLTKDAFDKLNAELEDAAKECPVPPKDGSRCALCRRKVMLDTRFKELCNGLCSAGGSTKSTKKTINAVNSASKILEIYRSLPAAGAGSRAGASQRVHLLALVGNGSRRLARASPSRKRVAGDS